VRGKELFGKPDVMDESCAKEYARKAALPRAAPALSKAGRTSVRFRQGLAWALDPQPRFALSTRKMITIKSSKPMAMHA